MSWKFSNLEGHLPDEVWESFVNHNAAAGVMLGVLFISLSYPLLHKMFMAKSEKYREKLRRDQQLAVIQHTIEAIFLSISFIPFTYAVFSANFEEQALESFKTKAIIMLTFMITIMIMYLFELASRFASLRPLVAVHHLCAFSDGLLTIFFLSSANMRACSLLVYFITYEALTFVGLIMYRLAPTHKLTRPTILAGMIVFGVSRPFQFVWIIGSLVVNWKDLILWQALIQVTFTVVFTTLQMYSLTIHFKLFKRCGEVQKASRNQYSNGTEFRNFDEESIVDVFELSDFFFLSSNDNAFNKEDIEVQQHVVDGLPKDTLKTTHEDSDKEDLVPVDHT